MGLFTRAASKKQEARLSFLRSKLRSGETEFTQSMGWERVGSRDAAVAILVTDQRVMWTDMKGPDDLALDIQFMDVVAFRGGAGEGALILEAHEGRYVEVSGRQTTIAYLLLKRPSDLEIVPFVEAHIPPAARERLPDAWGTLITSPWQYQVVSYPPGEPSSQGFVAARWFTY